MNKTETTQDDGSAGPGREPARTPPLRPDDRRLLAFIADFTAGNGVSPTYRDIRDGFGFRTIGPVQYRINRLAGDGYLVRRKNRARALWLTDAARHALSQRPGSETSAEGVEPTSNKAPHQNGVVDNSPCGPPVAGPGRHPGPFLGRLARRLGLAKLAGERPPQSGDR